MAGWRRTSPLVGGFESMHARVIGTFDARPGGVGLLGLGPVVIAAAAVALGRRDRLVVTLAAGAGLFALAWIALTHPTAPWVLNRLAGHARHMALAALLLALCPRLSGLGSARWRQAVGALLVGLIIWPTIVAPARSLGLAIANGVQLANASWVQTELRDKGVDVPMRRFQLRALTGPVADYLRDHTAVDARVLATQWQYWNVFLGTGRPNNAGFANLVHQFYQTDRNTETPSTILSQRPSAGWASNMSTRRMPGQPGFPHGPRSGWRTPGCSSCWCAMAPKPFTASDPPSSSLTSCRIHSRTRRCVRCRRRPSCICHRERMRWRDFVSHQS